MIIVQNALLRCLPERADELAAKFSRVAEVAPRDELKNVGYMVLCGPAAQDTTFFTNIGNFTSATGIAAHNTSTEIAPLL